MKRSALVLSLACATACIGAPPALARGAGETLTVSNTSSKPVTSKTALDPTHRYRLVARGTISDWCTPSSCPGGDPSKTAQPYVGVDALWCYAKWRCPAPELWRQLQVNGTLGIDQLAGLDGKIAYDPGHVYTVEFTGKSGMLSFDAWDARGSAADNSGSFTVQIEDLGPDATAKPQPAEKSSVRDTDQWRTFLGQTDAKDPRWATTISRRCNDLVETVGSFPGIKTTKKFAGEETTGVHSSQLYAKGGDLFVLLSGDDPPAELFKGNVYARATPYYEKLLREQIVASGGSLQPADVMKMALEATEGSYGLAVLTTHNLMKNVTKGGRETLGELGKDLNWKRPAKRQQLLDKMDAYNEVVSKLTSLRSDPADPRNLDKMGPWYHAFAVLTAGAIVNPVVAGGVTAAEHTAKFFKAFANEGGFNKEKASIDACFALRAVGKTLITYSRWFGS